jgi:hypothetical protein
MTRRFCFVLLLVLATAWLPANAALRAWVDNPTVGPGETVQLTLAHDGNSGTRPDLSPLKQDFDILGSSTSTSLQIVNGSASSTTQLELSLAPKRSGQLTIPSVTWGSDRSPALRLNVATNAGSAQSGANANANANANAAASGGRVFMETEEDPQAPYVQAAVHVTVRIFAGVPLSHGNLEFADTDAAIVRQVGSDNITNIERDGQPYQVITRHYILFPQHSGRLTIDGPTLSGEIPDRSRRGTLADPFAGVFGNSPFGGMFGARKPLRLHGDPIVLDVQPRPASAGASYWLPARNLTLQAHWTPSLQTHVGDPVTLELKLQTQGLTAAQLPDLASLLRLPAELKAYPDQPKLKDDPQGDDLISTREQSVALIADEPGQLTIPELRLNWWDTQTNQTREVILPAQTLNVLPAPGTAAPVQTPAQNPRYATGGTNKQTPNSTLTNTPGPATARESVAWKWVSLGLGLLWVATLLAWLMTRGRGGPNRSVPTAAGNDESSGMRARPLRAAFFSACRSNDATEARRNLLLWANAIRQSGAPIRGLNALAKLTDNPAVTQELQALDRACYAGASWDGTKLATLLPELPESTAESPGRRSRELAPLYR